MMTTTGKKFSSVVSSNASQSITGRTRINYKLDCGHSTSVTLPKKHTNAARSRALAVKRRACSECLTGPTIPALAVVSKPPQNVDLIRLNMNGIDLFVEIQARMDRLREIAAELRKPDANRFKLAVHIERIANEISKERK